MTTNAPKSPRDAVCRKRGHTAYAQQVTKAFLFTFALAFIHILLRFSFTSSLAVSLYTLHIR